MAVAALPFKEADMDPAENAPFTSLNTILFAVFAVVAVVAEFATLPAVLIVANFVSAIAALAEILELAIFEMILEVASIDLDVKTSVPASVANVPVVGKTNIDAAVVLKVISEAFETVVPEVVIEPPSVISLVLSFATPVPPLIG